jgi:hypothetical protein
MANFDIAVGRHSRHLCDLLVRGDLFGMRLQVLDHRLDGPIYAALEVHRVHSRCYALGTFPDDA